MSNKDSSLANRSSLFKRLSRNTPHPPTLPSDVISSAFEDELVDIPVLTPDDNAKKDAGLPAVDPLPTNRVEPNTIESSSSPVTCQGQPSSNGVNEHWNVPDATSSIEADENRKMDPANPQDNADDGEQMLDREIICNEPEVQVESEVPSLSRKKSLRARVWRKFRYGNRQAESPVTQEPTSPQTQNATDTHPQASTARDGNSTGGEGVNTSHSPRSGSRFRLGREQNYGRTPARNFWSNRRSAPISDYLQDTISDDISQPFYFLRRADTGDVSPNATGAEGSREAAPTHVQCNERGEEIVNSQARLDMAGEGVGNGGSGGVEQGQRKSLLSRISERFRAGDAGNGQQGNDREGRRGRRRPGTQRSWFLNIVDSFRQRAGSNATMKSGVYDFECDCQTALGEVRSLLEREYFGVLVSERYNEARMRVPLTVAGKLNIINIIVKVDLRSSNRARLTIRRAFGDALYVRHEDFDWFCFDVFRRLLRTRIVVRPFCS